jgi:VCBS repeat-containing protein
VQALNTSSTALTDTFTYTVKDPAGLTSSATLTVSVKGANDAPENTVVTPTQTATEDTQLAITGLSVTDVDGNLATTKLTVLHGVLNVTLPTGGATISAGANDSKTLTLSGTQAQINDALATLKYTPDANVNGMGADTLTMLSSDSAGTALTDTDTVTIDITAVNDAPVGVNDAASATEAGGTANGTAGTNPTGNVLTNDTDVDAGDTKTVQDIKAGSGTVSTVGASTTSANGKAVAGSFGTLTIGADGTYSYVVDNANTTVQALNSTSTALTDTFTYTVKDAAGLTSSATLTVSVNGANDAVVAVADTASATEASGTANGTAGTDPTGNVLTNDADVDTGDAKVLQDIKAGSGSVTAVSAGTTSSTGTTVAGTFGSLKIGADGTYSYVVNNANAGVQALNTSSTALTDTFTYTVKDAAGATSTATLTVSVNGANDAPVITTTSTARSYTENAVAIAVNNNLELSDVDSTNLAGATVQITSGLTDGDVLAFTAVNGITGSYDSTSGTLTLTGPATVAQYKSVLQGVTFASTSDTPTATSATRTLTWQVDDGSAASNLSNTSTSTINVTAVNDAPVNTLPAAQTTDEDVAKVIAGLAITDADAGNSSVTVTLAVGNGTISVLSGTGVTLSTNGTASVKLTGKVADINALLATTDSVTYTPTLNFNGSDTLTMTTNDGGNTGTGGTLITTSTVGITVTAVNDAPVGVTDTAIAKEAGGIDNTTAGTDPTGNVLTNDTDVDNATNTLVLQDIKAGIVAGAGTAVAASTTSADGTVVTGGFGTLTIGADGSYSYVVDNNNATVQALNTGNTGATALKDTFTYTVKDAAGATSTATLTVSVTGANDAPVITAGSTVPTYGKTAAAIVVNSDLSLDDVDSATLTGAVVTVSFVDNSVDPATSSVVSTDVLAFTAASGITGSYNATTGKLTLTGVASAAEYEAVLQSVTYRNSSTDPTAGRTKESRVLTWQVNDGSSSDNLSNLEESTITVTDAPNGGLAPTLVITTDTNNNEVVGPTELGAATTFSVKVSFSSTLVKANDILVFSDGTSVTLTAAQAASGSFTQTFAKPAEGAALTISAHLDSPLGASTVESDDDTATLDTTPPNNNVAPTIQITTDTTNDGFVNTAELNGSSTFTVKASFDNSFVVAGDSMIVSDGTTTTTIVLTADDVANGFVTTTFAKPAEGGTMSVTAKMTDLGGNTTPTSAADTAKLDTTLPNGGNAVVLKIVLDTGDDGHINAAEKDVATTTSLTATFDPLLVGVGDTVTFSDGTSTKVVVLNATDVAAGKATSTGWALPAEGATLNVTAVLADAAGNAVPQATDSARLDTLTPAVPTVSITTDTDNNGFVNTTELGALTKFTVTGTFDKTATFAGDKLVFTVGAATQTVTLSATDIANGFASIEVDKPAEGGVVTAKVKLVDVAGNASADSATDTATLDTLSAAKPTVTIATDANNDGFVNAAELGSVATFSVKATFDTSTVPVVAGDTVVFTDASGVTKTVTVTDADVTNGFVTTTFSAPVEGGGLSVTAKVIDKAGNSSVLSDADAATLITVTPSTTVRIVSISNDSGVAGDFMTNDNDGLTVGATLSQALTTGQKLQYSTNGGTTWTDVSATEISGTSVAHVDSGLTASKPVQMRVVDSAGNPGAVASQAVVIDTTAPTTTVTITAVKDDVGITTGTVANGGTTDDANPSLTGTLSQNLAEGETVHIFANGVDIGTAVAAVGTATWTFADNSNYANQTAVTYTAKVVDAAANAGNASAAYDIHIDTSVPTITVGTVAGDAVTASSHGTLDPSEWANLQLTTPTLPTITGSSTNVDGQTVTVTVNGKNYTATVATGGAWSVTLPQADALAFNNGNVYNITASVTNAAGNVASDTNNALAALVASPDVPTVMNLHTSTTTPMLGGLARHEDGEALVDGDTITIVLNGVTTTATVSTSATGTDTAGVFYDKTAKAWAVDTSVINFSLADHTTYSVDVTTGVNSVNKTDISTSELVINSTPPTITLNTIATDNIINNAEHNQALLVTGTTNAEVGSTVTLTGLDGTSRTATVIAGTGANTFSFTVAQADVAAFTGGITSFTANAAVTNSFGVSASVDKAVTVDITAPSIDSAATAAAQDENIAAATVIYTATTTESTGITYSLSGTDAAKFAINASTGQVSIKASPDFETKNSYSFDVVATDVAGNTSSKTVTLAINNVDEVAPSFTSGMTATVNENVTANTQVVYTAVTTDTDFNSPSTASSATYSLKSTGDAASFSVNSSTGEVTFKDSANFESKSSYSFTVIATDAKGNATEKAVTMSVANVNEAPVAAADTATAKEKGGVADAIAGTNPTGNLLTNDSDVDTGDVISVKDIKAGSTGAIATVSANGTQVVGAFGTLSISANGAYTYTVDNTNTTVQALNTSSTALADTFTYTVKDSAGLTSTSTLTVSVNGANDAPLVGTAIGATTGKEGVLYSVQANSFTDVDNSSLTYTATLSSGAALPSWLTFNATTRTFSGTPQLNDKGIYTVKLTGSDGSLSVSDTFTINIAQGNKAPVLVDKTLAIAMNTSNLYIDPVGAMGSLVTSFIAGITDADAADPKGIAITSVDTTKGTLWFSTDGGSTWSAAGAVSTTSALLLGADANNRVYFQPTGNTPASTIASAFTLRAWDGTSGTEGSKVDTTSTGGFTAFSTLTDTVAVNITTLPTSPVSLSSTSFVINGEKASDSSGYSVSTAGDVNGDGLDDLIVGAYSASGSTGKTYVVFGTTNNAAINLSAVAKGSGGYVINGQATGDVSGYSVSNLGDVNGDGFADVLIGARYATTNNVGYSYVVYGKSNTTAINLSAVAAGTGGYVIKGSGVSDYSGTSVSNAGDVNGDGIADLIVGAPYAEVSTSFPYSGRSYVVFGQTGTTAVDLSKVANGTGGFVINGVATYDYTGTSVSSAGDVNGDGFADLIVGGYGSGTAGIGYVVFGKATTTAVTLPAAGSNWSGTGGFLIKGASSTDDAGYSVSNAGDVNGDGLADLLVGAPRADLTTTKTNSGKAYVVFGQTGSTTINLAAVAAGTGGGFVMTGPTATSQAGLAVSYAGDINGDGLADVIVAAPYDGPYTGKTYVVYGTSSTAAIDLSKVALGSGGFVINGASSSDYSGQSVSNAGDINGDGFDDLVVGAYSANVGSATNAGKTYVLFGGTKLGAIVDYVGTTGADTQTGTAAGEYFAAGDGNDTLIGNGGADVMMGGKGNDTFVLNASNVTALQNKFGAGGNVTLLSNVDGGTGVDAIRLTDGVSLDLTLVSNVGGATPDGTSRINSIERIDLATDTGANTIKLKLKDVIDMSGDNVFNSTNTTAVSGTAIGATVAKHQVMITGDASDTANITAADWTQSTTVVGFEGHNYVVFNANNGVAAQLLIDQAMVNASGHVI